MLLSSNRFENERDTYTRGRVSITSICRPGRTRRQQALSARLSDLTCRPMTTRDEWASPTREPKLLRPYNTMSQIILYDIYIVKKYTHWVWACWKLHIYTFDKFYTFPPRLKKFTYFSKNYTSSGCKNP